MGEMKYTTILKTVVPGLRLYSRRQSVLAQSWRAEEFYAALPTGELHYALHSVRWSVRPSIPSGLATPNQNGILVNVLTSSTTKSPRATDEVVYNRHPRPVIIVIFRVFFCMYASSVCGQIPIATYRCQLDDIFHLIAQEIWFLP